MISTRLIAVTQCHSEAGQVLFSESLERFKQSNISVETHESTQTYLLSCQGNDEGVKKLTINSAVSCHLLAQVHTYKFDRMFCPSTCKKIQGELHVDHHTRSAGMAILLLLLLLYAHC